LVERIIGFNDLARDRTIEVRHRLHRLDLTEGNAGGIVATGRWELQIDHIAQLLSGIRGDAGDYLIPSRRIHSSDSV
jgi:hypothetical protein